MYQSELNPQNRWIQMAEMIPWEEIEKRYPMPSTCKHSLRTALGACLVQVRYGYSNEETVLQIQENPYLQFLCGFPLTDEGISLCAEDLSAFHQVLTQDVLTDIQSMIALRMTTGRPQES